MYKCNFWNCINNEQPRGYSCETHKNFSKERKGKEYICPKVHEDAENAPRCYTCHSVVCNWCADLGVSDHCFNCMYDYPAGLIERFEFEKNRAETVLYFMNKKKEK